MRNYGFHKLTLLSFTSSVKSSGTIGLDLTHTSSHKHLVRIRAMAGCFCASVEPDAEPRLPCPCSNCNKRVCTACFKGGWSVISLYPCADCSGWFCVNCIATEAIPDDSDSDAEFEVLCSKCYRERGNVVQEPEAERGNVVQEPEAEVAAGTQ